MRKCFTRMQSLRWLSHREERSSSTETFVRKRHVGRSRLTAISNRIVTPKETNTFTRTDKSYHKDTGRHKRPDSNSCKVQLPINQQTEEAFNIRHLEKKIWQVTFFFCIYTYRRMRIIRVPSAFFVQDIITIIMF